MIGENRNIYRLRYLGREAKKMQSRENRRFGEFYGKYEEDKKKWHDKKIYLDTMQAY